jgi:hypothetical protein
MFRKPLAKALNRPDRPQGGRPPYDAVMMFRILLFQALYGLSEEQAEFQIMDRRTLGRFFGFWMARARPRIGIGRQKPVRPIEGSIACGSYAKQS